MSKLVGKGRLAKKLQLQVWVEPDLVDWFEEHAKEWKVSRSDVIRWALRYYRADKRLEVNKKP